jgi:outer membrane receptor protein involved in Fe transport
MFITRVSRILLLVLLTPLAARAAPISGIVSDPSGAVVAGAPVTIRAVTSGRVWTVETTSDGRYAVSGLPAGEYFVVVRRVGFTEATRRIAVATQEQTIDLPVQLAVKDLNVELNVTAARAERDRRDLPLHVETIDDRTILQSNPLSTGDVLAAVPNITGVGGGPFGVRPRLRGLDSTRVLVLVDGERLNTARLATDRTGAEVGLVSPDALNRIEIVNGAGTVMYGSDALAGTINLITNQPRFSPTREFTYGLNGFYSSNEEGRRGTLTAGVSAPRYAVRVQGGTEQFRNYRAGAFSSEDTRPLFESGRLHQSDTIDDNFGFRFGAFADPFNAPYVRTSDEILNSPARGDYVNGAALVRLTDRGTLSVRYQRREMKDVGFPDFAAPYFFNATSLPRNRFERLSGSYEMQSLTPWLANLTVTSYYQGTKRLLRNQLPVQFPVPAPGFFPISVMRLDVLSDTEQRVWTPGLSVQARLTPAASHLVTTGVTVYRDRSSDQRTTTTQMSMVGQVILGDRGPEPIVFPQLLPLGPPLTAHPVRVPDATFRDIGVFVQDEWRLLRNVSLIAGLRGDFYTVSTEPTSGYNVAAVVDGANPAIDPHTLPDPDGATYTRRALTGDIGVIANKTGRVSPFVRLGRSFRHPNLEELLFVGPATIGSIVPNVTVKPETGTNLDFGANLRFGNIAGGAYFFLNDYDNFISQDAVIATSPTREPLSQTINYPGVRIRGFEFSASAPFYLRYGTVTLGAGGAFTRGTVEGGPGTTPLAQTSGGPADNITPSKMVINARFTEPRGRWWAEYGVRAQGKVSRVSPLLLDSPFLIAQDLLSLDRFAVQRLGAGVELGRGRNAVQVVFGVENLTNEFYREQFQFAPARGRSFTVGFNIGGSVR